MFDRLMMNDAARLGHSKAQQGGAFIPSAQNERRFSFACDSLGLAFKAAEKERPHSRPREWKLIPGF